MRQLNNKRSWLAFDLSARVALIGLQAHFFKEIRSSIEVEFYNQDALDYTTLSMAHNQNVFHTMLGKHFSKLCVSGIYGPATFRRGMSH